MSANQMRLLIGVVFLLACEVATMPATFTPSHEIVLPTVQQPAGPTPSQEVVDWPCDSINGWIVSPHCGLNPWFVAANANSDLVSVVDTVATMHVTMPNGTIQYRDYVYPAPPGYYDWRFDTVGHDGVNIIRGMIPIVRHNGEGFAINITGLTGLVMLRLEHLELFDPPGRYVLGFELTPELNVPEPARSNPALLRKLCTIWTDSGERYDLPEQNAGHNRYERVLDSAVYVVSVDRPLSISLECGLQIEQPAFDGQVILERFFVEAVPSDYGDSSVSLR